MPIFAYQCSACKKIAEELVRRPEEDLDGVSCSCGGAFSRAMGFEGFAVPGSEIGFSPYFDVGSGQYYKDRASRDADFKARGLVPVTRRERKRAFEDGMISKPPPDTTGKWRRASRTAIRRVREANTIKIAS